MESPRPARLESARTPRGGAFAPPSPRAGRRRRLRRIRLAQQAVYDPAPVAFTSYPLSPSLLEGAEELGFLETRPVQSAVIPYALAGDDVIGCRRHRHRARRWPSCCRSSNGCCASARRARMAPRGRLILAPTRELAVQIEDDDPGLHLSHRRDEHRRLRRRADMDPQERALRAGVVIVVATPGRLMDHMRSERRELHRSGDARARRSRPHDGHGLLARRPPHRRHAAVGRARRCSSRRRCRTK